MESHGYINYIIHVIEIIVRFQNKLGTLVVYECIYIYVWNIGTYLSVYFFNFQSHRQIFKYWTKNVLLFITRTVNSTNRVYFPLNEHG